MIKNICSLFNEQIYKPYKNAIYEEPSINHILNKLAEKYTQKFSYLYKINEDYIYIYVKIDNFYLYNKKINLHMILNSREYILYHLENRTQIDNTLVNKYKKINNFYHEIFVFGCLNIIYKNKKEFVLSKTYLMAYYNFKPIHNKTISIIHFYHTNYNTIDLVIYYFYGNSTILYSYYYLNNYIYIFKKRSSLKFIRFISNSKIICLFIFVGGHDN